MSVPDVAGQHSPESDDTGISTVRANRAIQEALSHLGISFREASRSVRYDPGESTASWHFNAITGEEWIAIGPKFTTLGTEALEMVVRHECLHRATYHSFHERFENHGLANLALDVCVNRFLFEEYEGPMRILAEAAYPPESLVGPVALANCAADPSLLPEPLDRLWVLLWVPDNDGMYGPINPASVYHRISRALSKAGLEPPQEPLSLYGLAGKLPQDFFRKVFSRMGLDYRNNNIPEKFFVKPKRVERKGLERFLHEAASECEWKASLKASELVSSSLHQVYPQWPSRRGLVNLLLGLENIFGYWNHQEIRRGRELRLGFYIDLSGSMESMYADLAAILGTYAEWSPRIRGFTEYLLELDLELIAAGNLRAGGGTNFDPPILDFLEVEELTGGILFTDGCAGVSPKTAQRLRESGKLLYVVYVAESAFSISRDSLGPLASRSVIYG